MPPQTSPIEPQCTPWLTQVRGTQTATQMWVVISQCSLLGQSESAAHDPGAKQVLPEHILLWQNAFEVQEAPVLGIAHVP